jgi:hypothetical protein
MYHCYLSHWQCILIVYIPVYTCVTWTTAGYLLGWDRRRVASSTKCLCIAVNYPEDPETSWDYIKEGESSH